MTCRIVSTAHVNWNRSTFHWHFVPMRWLTFPIFSIKSFCELIMDKFTEAILSLTLDWLSKTAKIVSYQRMTMTWAKIPKLIYYIMAPIWTAVCSSTWICDTWRFIYQFHVSQQYRKNERDAKMLVGISSGISSHSLLRLVCCDQKII